MKSRLALWAISLLAAGTLAGPVQAGAAPVDWIRVASDGPLRTDGGFTLTGKLAWAPDLPRVTAVAAHAAHKESTWNVTLVIPIGGSAHVGGTVGPLSRDIALNGSSPGQVRVSASSRTVAGSSFDVVYFLPGARITDLRITSLSRARLRVRSGRGSQLLRLGGAASVYAASASAGVSTMAAVPSKGIVGGFVNYVYGAANVGARSPDDETWSYTSVGVLTVPPTFAGPAGPWTWSYTGGTPGNPISGTVYGDQPGGISSNVVGAWAPIGAGWDAFRDP